MSRANLRIWLVDRTGVGRAPRGNNTAGGHFRWDDKSGQARSGTARRCSSIAGARISSIRWRRRAGWRDPRSNRRSRESRRCACTSVRPARSSARPRIRSRSAARRSARARRADHRIDHALRELALERLLLATLAAFVCGALILIFYVSRVSNRLRRAPRRSGARDRQHGPRARAGRRIERGRRDRRSLAQLFGRAEAPRAIHRLSREPRAAPESRAAHADRRRALVARQPAERNAAAGRRRSTSIALRLASTGFPRSSRA